MPLVPGFDAVGWLPGPSDGIAAVISSTGANDNQSLAIALATCLAGRGTELEDLGPFAVILGAGGPWMGPWDRYNEPIEYVPSNSLPVASGSLGLLIWLVC